MTFTFSRRECFIFFFPFSKISSLIAAEQTLEVVKTQVTAAAHKLTSAAIERGKYGHVRDVYTQILGGGSYFYCVTSRDFLRIKSKSAVQICSANKTRKEMQILSGAPL